MRSRELLAGFVMGIVMGVLFSAAVVLAGGLEPSGGPTAGSSQMYTLNQIYNRINNGTAATKMTTFTEPSSGPAAGTMHTLDEIYNLVGLRAPVPKTGQTKTVPFAAPSGSDGDLQKGVARPNPRFTDNNNGTVMDNLTGLIWLTNANCANATRDWLTALSDVVMLNTAGTMNGINCGDISNGGSHQIDWRLPNVKELQSLIDYAFYNPALSNTAGTAQWKAGDPFTGVQSAYYWSSSTYAGDTGVAWYVALVNGLVGGDVKSNALYVWPVRGGQ